LYEITLKIFGPTIHTNWKFESSKLQKELINKMVHLFDDGTFHKYEFNSKVGLHLKYLRDQYRSQLERVRSHEHHPSIPEMEWRVLMAYAHEKAL